MMAMLGRWMRAVVAAWVLVLTSVTPGVALAGELTSQGAVMQGSGDCKEVPLGEGSAADLVVKARLLGALCKDNKGVAAGLAFVAGLLTSLSPCVYPLIPITISIFGARQATSRLKAFTLSASYVLGMSVLYTVLGVAFASLGLISGGLMAIPAVVIAIGLLCVAMAASMFGAFEIALPAGVQTRLSQVGGAGYGGAFLMGLAAGVIAAPCTGPVLAVILSLISKMGQPGLGAFLMAFYSLGMGMLFLVLGTFSAALSKLPKSGRWMETVKSVLGLAMLGAGAYLVMPHVKPLAQAAAALGAVEMAPWVALGLLVAGVVLGALHLSFKDGDATAAARKGVGLTVATTAVVMWLGWLDTAPAAPVGGTQLTWLHDHGQGLAAGRSAGKPVMIDFGADWCAACKELEHKTYKDPAFTSEAQRFVTVLVDSTEMTDQMTELWKQYGITGLPVVVFYDSKGNLLKDPRVEGFMAANDFVAEMKKVQ